ncbi:MAG: helix-turn-helix domain-containing protein [Thermodesulfovibrionales bacterium]
MPAKSCRKIEVLIAADKILGVLADHKTPLSISDVSRFSGLSMDQAFRQLGTMEEIHWVDRIGEGYILGQRNALLWAKRKSIAEDRVVKAQRELNELTMGVNGE